MRNNITEEQITELMRAIPRAEEVDRLRADNERLRGALTDMLAGWRYIRETYGDLAGIGWDRAEQKAQEALEGES